MPIPNKIFEEETLCFKCANACGNCSWSDSSFQPIPGWVALQTKVACRDGKLRYMDSYHVMACPMFQADKKFGPSEIHEDGFKPLLYAILNKMVRDYAVAQIKYEQTAGTDASIKHKMVINEIESYVRKPIFEDIVNVIELAVDGQKLLKLIRSDPHGVLERIKADPDNFRGKQAEEHEEVKHRRNCRKEN